MTGPARRARLLHHTLAAAVVMLLAAGPSLSGAAANMPEAERPWPESSLLQQLLILEQSGPGGLVARVEDAGRATIREREALVTGASIGVAWCALPAGLDQPPGSNLL